MTRLKQWFASIVFVTKEDIVHIRAEMNLQSSFPKICRNIHVAVNYFRPAMDTWAPDCGLVENELRLSQVLLDTLWGLNWIDCTDWAIAYATSGVIEQPRELEHEGNIFFEGRVPFHLVDVYLVFFMNFEYVCCGYYLQISEWNVIKVSRSKIELILNTFRFAAKQACVGL